MRRLYIVESTINQSYEVGEHKLKGVLLVDLEARIEKRDDRWAAILPQLGITVYSKTEAEVRRRYEDAVEYLFSMFDSEKDGFKKLRAYLDKHRVKHAFTSPDPPVFTENYRRSVLVNA